ncbi:aspartyl/asparaginyl beta-hydroxylase isoform X2 [Anopheles bellator]|uniref:aspartyl/asparaginyl beta-hydroxylase isoform X2 n=1 Tax=Anopheles bellator TaxID=139047 RepID=UPI002649DB0F|nr:aspartyl/asparaginyl beta-hydroxylase isoform X2 [Anopheles bellator]
MSGDTQTKKRKDKKRKKDDEDTVKETTVHAPKQPSAGAAQAAKEPGDVQMHIHSDHGTGGHWCAKVVFFFLLGALGALIGLIIVENQGLSNDDTPLSESRYSEFFSGWVDETRQDDHHHEEILAAINSLDDHDDSVDDHDDSLDDHVEDHEAHEGEGEQDDHDDGAPYPEEEDNDDEEDADDDGDEEEAAQAQKLDDDEVEEIYAQQEAAQHEANVNPEGDDGDDGDYDDADDEDGDDDDKTKTVAETVDNEEENDDDEDDKDEQIAVKEDDDVKGKATNDKMGSNAELDDDDDDDDGNTFKGIDDTPFEEINLSNAMNDTAKQSLPIQDTEGTANAAPACLPAADSSKSEFCALPKQTEPNQATSPKSVSEHVTRDDLTDQMDELVRNYNKLAASLDVPQVEQTSSLPETDDDGDDFDGDEEEIEEETNKVGDDADENDDDEAAFDAFVDNDGGEEEYLARVRREQEQRLAAEEERKSAVEPEEETSQIPTRAEEAERSYQEELRRAQQQLDEGEAQEALSTFERVLSRKPHSIPALVGRGRALDALAEQRRSNAILNDAIVAYRKVIAQELAVDDATLASVAERCIDRLRFQGQHAKAIDVHQTLIRRFDDEPRYRNQLAVTYLYLNRLPEAKAVLHETLLRWIEDGFALVHYGFVLKTHDQNMELAAQYLREGIDTGHEGTQDGRFYFHLGDALQRLGRTGEAHDIYRRGVERKLFLSLYQRSLYNVDGLRSRPFWTEEQTTFAPELERIRSQWLLIRDEGMKLLTGAGVFVNETENLRDRGDWRQLELFARGARVERNCALAPLTCRLVEQHFPAARTCKRGQVKFSVMHPGTHVWPHCGPTNCRIRAHLGLNVPAGIYIRVAKQTRSWENGKWLIFDDSFEHEVWHNGTATRLVLIVDFWHPDLTESQRRSLSPI